MIPQVLTISKADAITTLTTDVPNPTADLHLTVCKGRLLINSHLLFQESGQELEEELLNSF